MVDNAQTQLEQAADRAGLSRLFGPIGVAPEDVQALQGAAEGDVFEIRFSCPSGAVGVVYVDVYDSGNPDDEGLTVGLRGWQLDEGVASV